MVLTNVVCFMKEEETYVTFCGNTEASGLWAAILFRSATCVDSPAMLLVSAIQPALAQCLMMAAMHNMRQVQMNEVPRYHTSDLHQRVVNSIKRKGINVFRV